MIQTLLDLDTSLLLSARSLISEQYIGLLRISAEMIVVYGALILIGLWLYGVWMKNNLYKISALQIFFTIILTFLIYTVLNFGIPQWRPNPQAISGAIAPLIPHPLDNSFPSGHALFTAALLVGLMRFSRNK